MSSGKILLSVLAGVAAGALLEIMFAPDKGWNTRKRISKNGEHYSERLEDKYGEFCAGISDKFVDAKEAFSGLGDPSVSIHKYQKFAAI